MKSTPLPGAQDPAASPASSSFAAGFAAHLRAGAPAARTRRRATRVWGAQGFGQDSEDFLRAMLAEGPFTASSRFASPNALTKQFGRAVPVDYPLPPIPKHLRRSVNRCVKDCVFKNAGCKGKSLPSCLGRHSLPLEYGLYDNLTPTFPKPYSIYLRGTIQQKLGFQVPAGQGLDRLAFNEAR